LRRPDDRARISWNVHIVSVSEILKTSQISFQEVLQLVELIKGSASFSELRIRSGDLEIDLRRGVGSIGPGATAIAAASSPIAASAPRQPAGAAPTPAAPNLPAATAPSRREGSSIVRAPMVGTVYLAAEPGAAPFATVGRKVEPGDQLCIIEVMKLMNAVVAESRGTVTEVRVGDGEAVEFGQELFVVSPH